MKRMIVLMVCIVQIQRIQSQTAEEIINKHIEAIGGYQRIKAIKTMIYESVTKMPDRIRRSTSYVIHDSAVHTDNINSKGETGYGIVTKTDGWTFDAVTNSMKKKTKAEIKEYQKVLDIHGPLIDYKQKGNKLKFLGKEVIDSSEYLKVRVIKHNKDRLIYFFDSSYFVFRVIYHPTGKDRPYTVDYSYQPIKGGYFFIHKSKHLETGIETVYTNYIVNPEIDRFLFLPHNVNKREQYH
jgi:hypothetical protein